MTTIAGVQGENWAVVGYDSRVTEENEKIYSKTLTLKMATTIVILWL